MEVMQEGRLKTFAVTGAGSGIGRAVAVGLAKEGYSVVALGRRKAALEETAAGHPGIHVVPLDVSRPEDCKAVFARIAQEIGRVDGLVCCAAIYPKVHFFDQTPESFNDTIVINVCGVTNVIREVLPGMLERNLGRIVVLGSLADNSPISTALGYSASKGALHAVVKGLAVEIDRFRYPNVLINELLPGATLTAMCDFGQTPDEVVPCVLNLVNFPSGGPTGRCYRGFERVRLGETWKQALLRMAGLRRD